MDRRSFLFVFSLGGLSAPLAADAQPTGKVYRIGYLGMGSATVSPPFVEAFREGLRELGLVEGQNIVIDYRFAEGRFDRLPELAAELVLLKVDVIMAGPTPPAMAAKNATGTIPIVMAGVGDPVEQGLIASLARPGGNVTGLSFSVGMDISGKGLELLREAVPKARRVAILSNPAVAAVAAAPWAGRRPSLGGLCHGDGGHAGGARRRRALMLPILGSECPDSGKSTTAAASSSLLTCMVVRFDQFSRKGALMNTRWAVGLCAIAL